MVLATAATCSAGPHRLTMTLAPTFDGQPLTFGAMTYTNASGQVLSVTRLDMLLSGFALQRKKDGSWLELSNRYACIRARDYRTTFEWDGARAGSYTALRFHVGLPPEVNNSDPSIYPAEHPLNPTVNGLHWSWQGGFVFLALEGMWQESPDRDLGYSFHLATDRQLMTVELPVTLELGNAHVRLALDVHRILGDVQLTATADSTHSRENDVLAGTLKAGAENAFSIQDVSTRAPPATALSPQPVAVQGTPYRFTFSQRFPMPQLPLDNPLTEEGVELGRRLFHEPLLSINAKQSCASCHQQPGAFTQPGLRFSPGAEGFFGKRNTMPLFNLAWKSSFFWDGRSPSLRAQARVPMEDPVEMHETVTNIAVKLAATTEYPELFERAFGSSDITPERIGLALEQFVLTLISCDSRFDRALQGREEFTEEEKRGFALFSLEFDPSHGQLGADCFHCHGGPLFSNSGFANNGLDATFTDPGRSAVTGLADDEGKFAVPSLRNVAITAPYMHDGRFATLEEVVEHYVSGIKRSATLDPNIAKHPNGGVVLSDDDKKAIVAFLKTLTDRRFTDAPPPHIPASARSAAREEAVPP